jgi:hypothetical protein
VGPDARLQGDAHRPREAAEQHDGRRALHNPGDFNGVCPKTAFVQPFDVTAALARDILPEATLVYNSRTANGGQLHDPTAIMFVRTTDIDTTTGKLKAGVPREPLVLRAKAGDCIEVTLTTSCRPPARSTSPASTRCR